MELEAVMGRKPPRKVKLAMPQPPASFSPRFSSDEIEARSYNNTNLKWKFVIKDKFFSETVTTILVAEQVIGNRSILVRRCRCRRA